MVSHLENLRRSLKRSYRFSVLFVVLMLHVSRIDSHLELDWILKGKLDSEELEN